MTSMYAVRVHEYGTPQVLSYGLADRPSPKPDEVLVRIHGAGVNQMDWKLRAGLVKQYFDPPLPIVPGGEIAGIIESVGSKVISFEPGDEVFAFFGFLGGYAQYAAVAASLLVKAPKNMSLLLAAAVPLSAQTALLGIRDLAQVSAGQRVFIHAAAGGVGQFAVQMAVAADARVTGTASKGNLARLELLGATEALDYAACDLRSHAGRYDVVFDLIGGDVGAASMSLLKPGGIFLGATAPPDARAAEAASARTAFVAVQPNAANLTLIRDQLEGGNLTLPPPIVFGLNEAADAHALSEGGHAPARIVLDPNP